VFRLFLLIAQLTCSTASLCGEVPASVLAEPDLEKRSELALKEADQQISAASKAYADEGALDVFRAHIRTVGELAELSLKSLHDTGKRASKKPKYFKRAELKLRSLLRRLDSLERDVSADDRPPVEKVKTVVTETHEQILQDIMAKR
jgi:hypothetical protein